MGKSSKPLSILVHPALPMDLYTHLVLQGHDVRVLPDEVAQVDVVIGPNMWAATEDLARKYLDTIIKNARARRYAKP